MAKLCPNCDKPLRDGSKFCTSCGHRLVVAKPTPAFPVTPPPLEPSQAPQQAQKLKDRKAAAGAGDVTCPNCGKPNRQGVKFCRYCGGDMAAASAGSQRNRARIVTISFLVLVILMVCVSLVGIGWGLGVDQFLFPTATPTPGANVLHFIWI